MRVDLSFILICENEEQVSSGPTHTVQLNKAFHNVKRCFRVVNTIMVSDRNMRGHEQKVTSNYFI
jgi:hypothetical protein